MVKAELKFHVEMDGFSDIKAKLKESCTKAGEITAIQVEKDTVPFVPALTGSMTTRTRVQKNAVIYPAPYARFLYYGKLMVDPTTGSAYAPKGGTKVETDKDLVFNKTMHPEAQAFWFEASKAENLEKWLRVADKAVKEFDTSK